MIRNEYQTREEDGIHYIVCPAAVEGKDAGGLEAVVKSWLLSTANLHILDFSKVLNLDPSAFRPFVYFNQTLKANRKAMFVINVRAEVLTRIKESGLASVFVVVANVNEARRKFSIGKPGADAKFINVFVKATETVLETQAQVKVTPGKPYLKKVSDNLDIDIAGLLSMNCSDFHGTISVCFRADVFLKIYENMVGEKHTAISSEVEDAAGEIVNIIFGQAKTVLNDQNGYNLGKALPTVLAGTRLKIHHQRRVSAIILPFSSSAGDFHMEIVVDKE